MHSRYELKRLEQGANEEASIDEVHALASIDDPHVSGLMEVIGPSESRPSLIFIEHPAGETLEARGTLVPKRAVHVAIQIAHALHAAHVAGVIHRNVRPKNVMLVRTAVDDAFVKLTNFNRAPKKKRDRFVPPEGAARKIAGPHTDVFGVGACLDAMIGPSQRRDSTLARIIARATAQDPKSRFASAEELESALRAWSIAPNAARSRDAAWYLLGALCAAGVAMIAFKSHATEPTPIAVSTRAAPVAAAVAAIPTSTAAENGDMDIGPPSPGAINGPPEPANGPPNGNAVGYAPPSTTHGSTYQPPAGSLYIDEPLRYVSATQGEAWRVATTKKVMQCVENIGTGDCALTAAELHCTIDRHGVVHCARLTPRDRSGKVCEVPPALDDCIGRAAGGVYAKPKFERPDVQLAEMKYWLRRAR